MTPHKTIAEYRAYVIEQTVNVEWLMNAIISQHYFNCVHTRFLLEVLCDEYFSFALKRRLIEKIIDAPDRRCIEKLNRINTIRNYFAHCAQKMFWGKAHPSEDAQGFVPDPRKLDNPIDFEKLYKEFTNIAGDVEEYLGNVFQAKGGQLHQYKDGHLIKTTPGD